VRRYASPEGFAVCALNPAPEGVTERFSLADLVGAPEAHVWDWGPGRAESLGRRRDLVVEAGGRSARLFYLNLADEGPPGDLTLGGRRTGTR
jgi:hypothetical protein